jgi:hypothetical protein
MAREAGFATSWTEAAGQALERFAIIVAAAAAEREECAKICDKHCDDNGQHCANAIRSNEKTFVEIEKLRDIELEMQEMEYRLSSEQYQNIGILVEGLLRAGAEITAIDPKTCLRAMPDGSIDCGLDIRYGDSPRREWVGLTDEEVMVAAYQAGFDIHEDYDNEDDPEEMHWWTPDGEVCDDSLLKLRDIIEAKLKEKNT